MNKTVAVIDGNSLMHRAFHAVPPTMNAPDGTPTNAVFGFLSMLLKFIDMERPDVLICAFDAGKPEFRLKAIEQYKANRPPMDPNLRAQFPVIEDILTSLNIPVVKEQGWEGDDILGTVSALCEAGEDRALLVSGDKDIYQLVTDRTRVVTTKKGMTDVVIYGPEEVEERYGVTPAQFIDFLGLKGDTSDNIPGVPGIGDVSAAKLLQKYGSMEGLYEHLDDLKGKQLENLRDNKDLAFASKTVATIMRNAPITLDLEEVRFPDYSAEQAVEAFGKYGFSQHLNHVLSYIGSEPQKASRTLLELAPRLNESRAAAALTGAYEAGEPLGLAVTEDSQGTLFGSTYYLGVCTAEFCACFEGENVPALVAEALRRGNVTCFDAKSLMNLVNKSDCSGTKLTPAEWLAADVFDCSLAAYVADSSAGTYGWREVLASCTNSDAPSLNPDDKGAEALWIATAALAAREPLVALLEERNSLGVYRDIDLPLVPVLGLMEQTGVKLDTARLASMSQTAHGELDQLRREIYEQAGEEFNVDSPAQLSVILFEKMQLPHKKKTARGYSTDASVLSELAELHPLPGLILRYREQTKLANTYLDALPRLIEEDGLVHGSFNQMATTTGRLSSSDPNLQNIPVRTEFGREVRRAFVPLEPDHVFLSADYSQIELRLLAHLSGDERLIDAFISGADFHASTASRVFGVPLDGVTPEMRSRAKAVNFGIVYGQQAFGLSQSLGIPFYEAKEIIDRYFITFPGVRQYLDRIVADARKNGYAETMFGRRRYIPELSSGNAQTRAFGERTAMNHPMQGSAADIIKLAMRAVAEELAAERFDARMMIQVHDELDFSVAGDRADEFAEAVKRAMEGVVSLRVPLIADVSRGATWAEAH